MCGQTDAGSNLKKWLDIGRPVKKSDNFFQHLISVANPDPFDTNPDPAVYFDTDPDLVPYHFKEVMNVPTTVGTFYQCCGSASKKCGCESRKKSQCGCGSGFMFLLNYGEPSKSIRNL